MAEASVRPTAAPGATAIAVASERATAAAQMLQQAEVQPSVSSAITAEPTTTSHVEAVQAFLGLPSAVRRGRPPGSTNRSAKATTASTQNNADTPKGPGHEHFPVTTWSLTISRVSKDPKNNDVPPEFLANVKVFFDEYCVRGIIHNILILIMI